jgi:hypothetical protein
MSCGTEPECVIVVLFHVILKFQRKKVEGCAPFRVYEGALFAVLHLYLQIQICCVCWQVINSTGITLHRGINSDVDKANHCTDVTHHRIIKCFSSFFKLWTLSPTYHINVELDEVWILLFANFLFDVPLSRNFILG